MTTGEEHFDMDLIKMVAYRLRTSDTCPPTVSFGIYKIILATLQGQSGVES